MLNRFIYGAKMLVPDDVMETIRDEIHDETYILYNYTRPITIPMLECILKRNELTMYKDSIYYIFFNPISTVGRCFPRKFCLPVDNFFSFESIATKFGDFS